ncbi:MAG: hypothetical protein WC788_03240 [Candidatus Paceibacterota bacterium]|jgi:hypothetical protein
MVHPFKNRSIESAEQLIVERVANEEIRDFSFCILKLRLGEVCPYETLEAVLNNLIDKGKVIKGKRTCYGDQRYNLVQYSAPITKSTNQGNLIGRL